MFIIYHPTFSRKNLFFIVKNFVKNYKYLLRQTFSNLITEIHEIIAPFPKNKCQEFMLGYYFELIFM